MDNKELFSNLEEFPSAEELFRIDAEPEEEAASPDETEESEEKGTAGKTQENPSGERVGSRRGMKIFLVVVAMLLLAAAVCFENFYAGGWQSIMQWF